MTSFIDFGDHDGLRGFMAIWIVVFHALLYTKNPVDFQGSSLMPMFFMLSGYSLTVGYHSKLTSNSSTSVVVYHAVDQEGEESKPNDMQKKELLGATLTDTQFIVNRLIRTLPVYYFCLLLVLPPAFQGFAFENPYNKASFNTALTLSFIPVSTWIGSTPLDGPAWTVQTLIGMWIFFPMALRILDKYSDTTLLIIIRFLYWLQLVVLFLISITLFLGYGPGFVFATMHPISRFPVFAMGIAAGIISVRHKHNPNMVWFRDSNWLIPWRSTCCCCCCRIDDTDSSDNQYTQETETHTPEKFKSTMYVQSFQLVLLTLSVFVLDCINRSQGGSGILGAIWMSALVPYSQLNILVSMSRHNSRTNNNISAFLRSSVMKFLGTMSMSIYLVHFPLAFYMVWARYDHAKMPWPSTFDCSQYSKGSNAYYDCKDQVNTFYDHMAWPQWLFVVLPVFATCWAYAMYHGIEVPTSKWKY